MLDLDFLSLDNSIDLKLLAERLQEMDSSIPSRRPHKFPAHTVKDHQTRRPSGLTSQGVSLKGAAHYTRVSEDVNTFAPTYFRPPTPSGPSRAANYSGMDQDWEEGVKIDPVLFSWRSA